MIKKFSQIKYGILSALVVTPMMVSAQIGEGLNQAGQSGLANTSIVQIITNLMQWLLVIVAVIAVIAFVVAGILYLTAAGDESRAEKAKSAMLYSIVGVIVALIGLIVINAVDTWLRGSSTDF